MNRAEFLARLKRGLVGLPAAMADEIIADYESHFADGLAAGRTEQQVADALGNPDKLARELKAEAGAKAWGQQPTPSNAMGAIFGIIGLGAVDILILLPLVLPVFGTIFAILIGGVGILIAGGTSLIVGPFLGLPGGALAAVLMGVGLIGLGIFTVAVMAVLIKLLIDATIWYARLHYRVVKPALEPAQAA
jgi:uncharacterized membrane protein